MSVQRNDWSLQRKGIIDQDRHKERIKEAIRKNLGSIVSNESIILSNGRRTVKVPMRALDEYNRGARDRTLEVIADLLPAGRSDRGVLRPFRPTH